MWSRPFCASLLVAVLVSPMFAQEGGRRAEIQESLQSRYRLTRIGPSALGFRGKENSVRQAGGVVVLKREGLYGTFVRSQMITMAIYGDKVEVLAGDTSQGVPLKAGGRFYVVAVTVGVDSITIGLLSVGNVTRDSQSAQVWGSLNFFFDKETLERGDAEKIYPRLDQWLATEGSGLAPVAAAPAAEAALAAPASAPGPAPAATSPSAVISLQPGMSRDEVVNALGGARREVQFEDRRWMEYPGMTAVMEKGRLVSLEPVTAPAVVKVASDPGGAEVYIEGSFVGTTPAVLQLPPGSYKIAVRQPGYQDWQRDLKVFAGSEVNVAAHLSR